MKERILIVDDEQSMRAFLSILLKKEGYQTEEADDGKSALQILEAQPDFDLVISDVKMAEVDGIALLKKAKAANPAIEFIVMTAYSSTGDAIAAMKEGAYDYLTKPFDNDEMKLTIRRALEKRKMASENENLKEALQQKESLENMIGQSEPMRKVFEMILQVADTKSNVLIMGESGTGKELAAKAIHAHSARKKAPFVTVNCGAIPGELMESELFGHIKGAFTGAVADKEGYFAAADGGTLFLDEIAELPLLLQVKLLRALQEKCIAPVGGSKERSVDVRVISATNRALGEEVSLGNFREDLFYRLNVIQIILPPLRERKDDIPLLIHHFMKRSAKEESVAVPVGISKAALMVMMKYDYPGNVRELANIIERAIALQSDGRILPVHLPEGLLEHLPHEEQAEKPTEHPEHKEQVFIPPDFKLDEYLMEMERRYYQEAMRQASQVKTRAAEILGISFRSFRYRMKKLGLEDETASED